MNKVLLLSPHFDDAVLSAGQFMAGRPDTVCCTVFAGTPKDGDNILTDYDKKCGFNSATQAMVYRHIEDENATAMLNSEYFRLDYLDGQYKERDDAEFDDLCHHFDALLQEQPYDFVLAPLGLGHPDHEFVSDAIWLTSKLDHIKTPVYFWEDLPLRVVEPELVQPRLDKLGLTEKVHVGDGPIAKKIRALSCYKSQIGTGILDPYLMYVPERFWK